MFNKKQRIIDQLRMELSMSEQSLSALREQRDKMVAEMFQKDKKVEYLQGELVSARRDVDSLRGRIGQLQDRRWFKKPQLSGLKRLIGRQH